MDGYWHVRLHIAPAESRATAAMRSLGRCLHYRSGMSHFERLDGAGHRPYKD